MRDRIYQTGWMCAAMIAALILAFTTRPAAGQFRDYGRPGLGGGLSLGGVVTNTELADAADFQVRAYVTHGLSDRLSAELGAGYASLAGDEYLSDVALADVRLQYSFLPTESWSPFAYAGAGVLRYDWAREAQGRTDGDEPIGWGVVIPLGVGIRHKLTDRLSLDLNGGYNFTTRDDINSISSSQGNDMFWGVRLGIGLGSDPDPDGDGLYAKVEERAGTHPRMLDSDGDGLTDGDEIRLHRTDPANGDTDGDGWSDGDELALHGSNPRRRDRIDSTDLVVAAAPASEVAPPVVEEVEREPVAPEPLVLPDFAPLHFAFGRAVLDAPSLIEIGAVCHFLATNPLTTAVLRGHTDDRGSIDVNRRLSQERADAVRAHMIDAGVDGKRILALGLGPEQPIAPNATAEGRRLNRRVEVIIIDGTQASSF